MNYFTLYSLIIIIKASTFIEEWRDDSNQKFNFKFTFENK